MVSVGFGIWGWMAHAERLGLSATDVLYRSLSALWLSDMLQSSSEWNGDLRIETARWAGVVAFVVGATKALAALLSDRAQAFRARRRRGHVVVAGNARLAQALVDGALDHGEHVHWIGAPLAATSAEGTYLVVGTESFSPQTAHRYAVARSKWCAVAVDDDAQALAISRQLRQIATRPDSVLVQIRSPWLALHVDDLPGMAGVRLFPDAQMAVRCLQRRHPPFLLARRLDHRRIHSLIVGFGRYGEAVLIETLLSSLTTDLGKPRFTIVDPETDRIREHLSLRYPEIDQSADIELVKGSLEGTPSPLGAASLLDIGAGCPVTCAYVCAADQDRALTIAMALRAVARREALIAGPINVRLSEDETLRLAPPGAGRLERGELIPFGMVSQLLTETGLTERDPDGLAKALHEAYRAVAAPGKEANVPWNRLAEDYRDSNRRLVVHIPAKLASAGIDIEPWLAQAPDGRPEAWPDVSPIDDSALLERLAALEHDRWMADRRLNGWQHAASRDDLARRHPDLVPYEQLPENSKRFDRTLVQTLFQALSARVPTSRGATGHGLRA